MNLSIIENDGSTVCLALKPVIIIILIDLHDDACLQTILNLALPLHKLGSWEL
jgi:hypothetical protein